MARIGNGHFIKYLETAVSEAKEGEAPLFEKAVK